MAAASPGGDVQPAETHAEASDVANEGEAQVVAPAGEHGKGARREHLGAEDVQRLCEAVTSASPPNARPAIVQAALAVARDRRTPASVRQARVYAHNVSAPLFFPTQPPPQLTCAVRPLLPPPPPSSSPRPARPCKLWRTKMTRQRMRAIIKVLESRSGWPRPSPWVPPLPPMPTHPLPPRLRLRLWHRPALLPSRRLRTRYAWTRSCRGRRNEMVSESESVVIDVHAPTQALTLA